MIGLANILGLAAFVAAAAQQPLPAADPEARKAMQTSGRCIADRSSEYAAETLVMDFGSPAYRQRLRQLASNNPDCFQQGVMRAGNLAFAGAVAERLLLRSGEPLNRRLVQAAARGPAVTWSPTDAAAMCVVRSVPDDVAKLFATAIGSEGELKAAGELAPLLSRCTRGNRTIEATPAGMRAMLATAAFRSLHTAAPSNHAGR